MLEIQPLTLYVLKEGSTIQLKIFSNWCDMIIIGWREYSYVLGLKILLPISWVVVYWLSTSLGQISSDNWKKIKHNKNTFILVIKTIGRNEQVYKLGWTFFLKMVSLFDSFDSAFSVLLYYFPFWLQFSKTESILSPVLAFFIGSLTGFHLEVNYVNKKFAFSELYLRGWLTHTIKT